MENIGTRKCRSSSRLLDHPAVCRAKYSVTPWALACFPRSNSSTTQNSRWLPLYPIPHKWPKCEGWVGKTRAQRLHTDLHTRLPGGLLISIIYAQWLLPFIEFLLVLPIFLRIRLRVLKASAYWRCKDVHVSVKKHRFPFSSLCLSSLCPQGRMRGRARTRDFGWRFRDENRELKEVLYSKQLGSWRN